MSEPVKNSVDTKYENYTQPCLPPSTTTRPVYPNVPLISMIPSRDSQPRATHDSIPRKRPVSTANRISTMPNRNTILAPRRTPAIPNRKTCIDGKRHCWVREPTLGGVCWFICCFPYGSICCYLLARKHCARCHQYKDALED
jgi:hypothetical protein